MPGFLTHYLAGQVAVALLPDEIAAMCKGTRKQIFSLGTQGSDIFFYYVPGYVRKRTRNIGTVIHQTGFAPFFLHMARITKQIADAEQKEILFSYLAGFLVHYAVDANTHPFVFARSALENASEIAESASHRHLETTIDVLMLARLRGEKPANYKQWELIQAPLAHRRYAAKAFAVAASHIYHHKIKPLDVYNAMGHMIFLTQLLHSKNGRRKRIAAFIEEKTINAHILSSMVHPQEITIYEDALNLGREDWGSSTASFPELFNTATEEAERMIVALFDYVYDQLPLDDLSQTIGNRSLITGEDL